MMDNSLTEHYFTKLKHEYKFDNQDDAKNIIEEIYQSGYDDCFQEYFDDSLQVGNKVTDNLSETLKAEYLGEIFDKYSEQDFRQMAKQYDIFIQAKRQEALLFAS